MHIIVTNLHLLLIVLQSVLPKIDYLSIKTLTLFLQLQPKNFRKKLSLKATPDLSPNLHFKAIILQKIKMNRRRNLLQHINSFNLSKLNRKHY